MTREEAIKYLEKADITVYQPNKTKTAEAVEMAIRSLEAWDKVIKEMQSRKATFPTPSKENWNKEVIARNIGIDECIEIVMKYLKGGD